MQTSSVDNTAIPSKPTAKYIRQTLILCEKTDLLINDDSQTLIHPEMHSLRSKIIKLCKTIFIDMEWGRRILDRVWKSCYYSVICRIRRAALSVEQKNWTEKLISTFVKELCIFANDFPYLRAAICLYIGDLRRYAWLIYRVEKYRNLALLCYQKSVKLDEENGLALNQLGLLVQEASPSNALLYFLLANNASLPFESAYTNVISLLKQQKEQKKESPTIAVLEHCFTCFRQSYFEELSTKCLEYLILQLETRHAFHVALSINIIILSAITLSKKGKETELQSLSKLFFRISEIAVRNLQEWYAADIEAADLRRRRASSSDESEDEAKTEGEKRCCSRSTSQEKDVVSEDDETTIETEESNLSNRNNETYHRIQTLLVALLHAASSLAPHVYNDKVPSALHCQYEDFCQQLIQFLNLLELHLEGKSESLWQLGGSTPWLLLSRFLQTFVHSPHTPVEFDEFFLYTPKNSLKENKMKNMAKLWLAHDAEKEYIRTSLPLYVVPQEDVLLQRLEVMKKILKKDKLIVAIAEGTFRSLDMKKDKPEVRKALRWINAHISKDNGRLRIISNSTPEKCAEKLSAQAPTTSTVFVTVLTLSQVEANPVIKPITMENVEDFCARYDKAQKDFLLCH
ncbi:Nonsense-mediated mRNA decay factor [Dirofilaria immitis]